MTRTFTRLAVLAGLLAAFLTLNGGSSAAVQGSALTAHSSRYGKVLFDGRGRVLYLFARDRGSRSTCYGACATAWPPFLTRGAPRGLRGVDPKLLGTTKRRDGTLQVTYAKHPLYYFKEDTRPGQITCQDVANFGGLWLVVSPSGKAVR